MIKRHFSFVGLSYGSLRSWWYCVAVEWRITDLPSKLKIVHRDNTASYASCSYGNRLQGCLVTNPRLMP